MRFAYVLHVTVIIRGADDAPDDGGDTLQEARRRRGHDRIVHPPMIAPRGSLLHIGRRFQTRSASPDAEDAWLLAVQAVVPY